MNGRTGRLTTDSNCDNCAHASVCSKKSKREFLESNIKDLLWVTENQSFSVLVSCAYFKREEGLK